MDKVLFSSKTDLWATPQEFFDSWDMLYSFNTDVCALPENAKCPHYFTPEQDGLKQPWNGTCWMNPPYGREAYDWIKKAYEESRKGVIVVALIPARTDTRWFHEYVYKKQGVEVQFIKGRLKFGGSKDSAPFPSMVVIFNVQNTI
jgi:phage N-6-adenine-methyltransferase